MIEAIINNEWLQLTGLILTIATGFWFFWEKIRAAAKTIREWAKHFWQKTPHTNPFTDQGRITDAFFGRQALLRTIFAELKKGTNLSLISETQMGKSSLLSKVRQLGAKELPKKTFIELDMFIVHDEGDFFKALCGEIGIQETRGYELHRALKGKQYVLCLDNIERMTSKLFSGDERTELRGLAEGKDAPLTLLIASHSPLNTLFPDDYSRLEASPLDNICQRLDMPPFSPEEVRTFIKTRLQPTGIQLTEQALENIWHQSQGHPYRVQQVAAELYRQRTAN